MAATLKKERNWATLEDEDEERLEPHYKEEKIIRTKEKANDKNITIEEVVLQKKWVIPVRKQVKDRKNWNKFGEVANIPKGEHRPGDFAVDNPIEIQTSGEQGELKIIQQLSGMTADTMKGTREQRKLDELEGKFTKKEGKGDAEKKEDKWSKVFSGKQIRDEYSIRVLNIITFENDWAGIIIISFLFY